MMASQPALTSSDGSSNPPERCPHPLYSQDSTQEDITISHKDEELKDIKFEEKEEMLVSGEQSLEKDDSLYCQDSTQRDPNIFHHDQAEKLKDIKVAVKQEEEEMLGEKLKDIKVEVKEEEEETLVSGDQPSMKKEDLESKQEEYSLLMDTNRCCIRKISDQSFLLSAGCKSEDNDMIQPPSGINRGSYCLRTSVNTSYAEQFSEQSHYMKSDISLRSLSEDTSTDPSNSEESSLSHEGLHNVENPFACLGCGESFKRKSELLVHLRSHTSVTFSCSECRESFIEERGLLAHQKTHKSENPYSCSECGKCFTDKKVLLSHQRMHTGERPYSCSACGNGFTRKSTLLQHLRIHTGERPFSCSECGKCFTRKGSLNIHQRSHKGEWPFSCSECGKSFTVKAKLLAHQRSHTGEHPFCCLKCGKCFTWRGSLNRHMESHNGERPFPCAECGKGFLRKEHLIKHQFTHS